MSSTIQPYKTLCDPGAYVSAMINQPWEKTGLHCWALVRKTLRDVVDVEVPPIVSVVPERRISRSDLFNFHPERKNWREATDPVPWAVALMSRKGAKEEVFEHAGVYFEIDGGGIFHTDYPHGCVWDTLYEFIALRNWAAPKLFVPV